MIYKFSYCLEYQRVVQAVTIDRRSSDLPTNANGNDIQPIVDAIIGSIKDVDIFYKIETLDGNLSGYFILQVKLNNQSVLLSELKLIPSFISDAQTVNDQINNFILNGTWRKDYLFPG